jgi:hypothetical protein
MEEPADYSGIDFPFFLPPHPPSPEDCPVAAALTLAQPDGGGFSAFQMNVQLVRALVARDRDARLLPDDYVFRGEDMTAEQIVHLIGRQKMRRCKQITAERKGLVSIPSCVEQVDLCG